MDEQNPRSTLFSVRLVRSTLIACDGPGCSTIGPRVHGWFGVRRRARRVARKFGWIYIRGLGDFCPEHTPAICLQVLREES